VIVIGGGVIGGSCAFELRKKGFTTLNVDTNPAAGYGSTSSSSAIIRHFYSLEDSCRLAWESYHHWAAWGDYVEATKGEDLCGLHEVGCAAMDVPASPAAQTYMSRVRSAMQACNVPVEEWDAAEIQRRMPYMSTTSYFPPRRIDDDEFGNENGGEISSILYCPKAGYVNDPQLSARNVVDAAMRRGGEFKWRARVVKINRDESGSKVTGVTLEDGSIVEAPIVINVAGPHSQAVHDLAFQGAAGACDDSRFRSKPLKVEVAYVQEPPGSRLDETFPMLADIDVGVYMRPQQGGQLLIGSIEPECDELHFLEGADELEDGLTDEWNSLVYRAALRFPTLQVPNTAAGLVALYDTTPDFVPIYDKTSLGGFYSIRGTSGNQFKNAPVVGKICAVLVDGVENGRDHDTQPLSMPCEHTSGSIDLGMFSRLRGTAGTTGTVLG
jgi:sarcosine oxidase subunit beta